MGEYKVSKHNVPANLHDLFAERIEGGLQSFSGGLGWKGGTGDAASLRTYTFKMDGREQEVLVEYDRSGVVTVAFPLDTSDDDCRRILNAIGTAKVKSLWFFAVLSLGFAVTDGVQHVGPYWLCPVARGHQHGMRTGISGRSGGLVYDHVLLFPALAVDGFKAQRRVHEEAVGAAWLFSWLLDHPAAAFDHSQVVHRPDRSDWPVENASEAGEILKALGCVTDGLSPGHREGGRRLLALPSDASAVYSAVATLPPKPGERVGAAIESYARALLHYEPEPGFRRYHDVSFAVTQWMTVVESLAEPAESQGTCPECKRPRQTGAGCRGAAKVRPPRRSARTPRAAFA